MNKKTIHRKGKIAFLTNKASNWQIVAQIKLFSDLCDSISLYRQNYTRPVYLASDWLVGCLVDG